jgi:hypothetical protein
VHVASNQHSVVFESHKDLVERQDILQPAELKGRSATESMLVLVAAIKQCPDIVMSKNVG